jgi:CheY-like chemotaxis protein
MADATSDRAVLVVDDDRDLRELVADVLEGSGRRVFTASDGADALRRIDGEEIPRPCIILLDWFMAPMGGDAFLEQLTLRPCADSFRVFLLSASSTSPPPELRGKVVGVLRKPFSIEELLGAVDGLG